MNRSVMRIGWLAVTLAALLWLGGCGGSSSSNGEDKRPPGTSIPTTLTEAVKSRGGSVAVRTLEKMGIDTPGELADTLKKRSPLDLLLAMKKVDANVTGENLSQMMKEVEIATTLARSLQESGVKGPAAANTVRIISAIDLPYHEIRGSYLRPYRGNGSQKAKEAFYRAQWRRFNETAEANGIEPIDYAAFTALSEAVQAKRPLFDFVVKPMQNVDANSSALRGVSTRDVSLAQPHLNPVDESAGAVTVVPTEYLRDESIRYRFCFGETPLYPMQIVGYDRSRPSRLATYEPVAAIKPLTGVEGEERWVQFNRTGIALLRIVNRGGTPLSYTLRHRGGAIVETTLETNTSLLLSVPVMPGDLCETYRMLRDDERMDIFVESVESPVAMEPILDSKTGHYLLYADLDARNTSGERIGQVATFSLPTGSEGTRTLNVESTDPGNADYLLLSPSGTLRRYVSTESRLSFTAEPGRWLFFVLPETTPLVMSDGNLSKLGLDTTPSSPQTDRHYSVSLDTGSAARPQRFVVAELHDAIFAQDGEEDPNNPGELFIQTKTNMAPRLDIEPDLQRLFNSVHFPALRCWQRHGRDVREFSEGGDCADHLQSFRRILEHFYLEETGYGEDDTEDDPEIPARLENHYSIPQQQRFMYIMESEFRQKAADLHLDAVYDIDAAIYDNWRANVVQINAMRYPVTSHAQIKDTLEFYLYDYDPEGEDEESPDPELIRIRHLPQVMVKMPVFAVPESRMARSTAPFSFDYEAYDDDEVDADASTLAMARFMINQAFAFTSGNYLSLLCNSIDLMKELRAIEKDGEDEALGSANLRLNRFSDRDTFYGFQNAPERIVAISGEAEVPDTYTTYDRGLDYAGVACNLASGAFSAYNLYNSLGGLLCGDSVGHVDFDAIEEAILSEAEPGSPEYQGAMEALEAMKNGALSPEMMELLKLSQTTEAFSSGIDLFRHIEEASETLGGMGGQGYNTIRSEAAFFFSSFQKAKTQGHIALKTVDAQPIRAVSVTLDRITIYNNKERSGDGAEVRVNSRVGIIGDTLPVGVSGELTHTNGSEGYQTYAQTPFIDQKLTFDYYEEIDDGDTLPLHEAKKTLYRADYPQGSEAAAVFVEVDLLEDDGWGTIDDDTIGIFSDTFYLEDIFNRQDEYRIEKIAPKTYRIHIQRPIYDASGLETAVEIVDRLQAQRQRRHNTVRGERPSAYLNLHIDVTLGDFIDHPPVSTDPLPDQNTRASIDLADLSPRSIDAIAVQSGTKIVDMLGRRVLLRERDDTVCVAQVETNNTLTKIRCLDATNMPAAYGEALANGHRILDAAFVTKGILAIFFSGYYKHDRPHAGHLFVVTAPPEGHPTAILDHEEIAAPIPTRMATLRKGDDTLVAVIPVIDMQSDDYGGRLMTYRIARDTVTPLENIDALGTPSDILALDDHQVMLHFYEARVVGETASVKRWKYKANFYRIYDVNNEGELFATSQKSMEKPLPAEPVYYGPFTWSRNFHEIDPDPFHRLVRYGTQIRHLDYLEATRTYLVGKTVPLPYSSSGQRTFVANPEQRYYFDDRAPLVYDRVSRDAMRRHFDMATMFPESTPHHIETVRFFDGHFLLASTTLGTGEGRLCLVDMNYTTPPSLRGDAFDDNVMMNHAGGFTATVPFALELHGQDPAECNVTFAIYDDNGSLLFSGTDTDALNRSEPATYWYRAAIRRNGDGTGEIRLRYDKPCTRVHHRYEVKVRWRGYESRRTFDAYLRLTPPDMGEDRRVTLAYDETAKAYESMDLTLRSHPSLSAEPNVCIDRFQVMGAPMWLHYETVDDGMVESLHLTAQPTEKNVGHFTVDILAINAEGDDEMRLDIEVLAPPENNASDDNATGSDDNATGGGSADTNATLKSPPLLEGGYHALDENESVVTFEEDADWRSTVTALVITPEGGTSVTLRSGESGWRLEPGRLILVPDRNNAVPTTPGSWFVEVEADGYENATTRMEMTAGAADPVETNATLALDTFFAPGTTIQISLQARDRFGNPTDGTGLQLRLRPYDADPAHLEPYRFLFPDGTAAPARPTPMHPDARQQAAMAFDGERYILSVILPGTMDAGDGFDLEVVLNDKILRTIDFRTSEASDTITEWGQSLTMSWLDANRSRYRLDSAWHLPNAFVLHEAGKTYLAAEVIDAARPYADYARRGSMLWVGALDENGVLIWENNLTTPEGTTLSPRRFRLESGTLCVTLVTDGNLSERSDETAGADLAAAYALFSATDGALLARREWSAAQNEIPLDIHIGSDGVLLTILNHDSDDPTARTLLFPSDGSAPYELFDFGYDCGTTARVQEGWYCTFGDTLMGFDSDGSELWSVRNDGRNPGDSDYNYATLLNLSEANGSLYGVGTARRGYFDQNLSPDDTYYPTLVKRAPTGGYAWSRALDAIVNGRVPQPTNAVESGDALYLAYDAPAPCHWVESQTCEAIALGILNRYTGEPLETLTFVTDLRSDTEATHTLRPLALAEGEGVLYLLGYGDGYAQNTQEADGRMRLILYALPRHDVATDSRTGVRRNDQTETVADFDTGLEWQDDASIGSYDFDTAAAEACVYLTLDGAGWRLPAEEELRTILDENRSEAPYLPDAFNFRESDTPYWDANETDADHARGIDFSTKTVDTYPKSSDHYTRCVRDLPR